MKSQRRFLTVLALLLAGRTGAARADVHGWTLCTPGSLRSCQSLSINTAAIFTGSVRTGTAVVIHITNVQGSTVPNIGTALNGLYQIIFMHPVSAGLPVSQQNVSATMTGGATGTLNWKAFMTNALVGSSTWAFLTLEPNPQLPLATQPLLGGCTAGTTVHGTITGGTCGTAALATFTLQFNGAFDASGINNVSIFAYGARGSESCYSNPGAVPFNNPTCDVLAETPTVPEPQSIVLLATGLMGMGFGGWRRRRTRLT